MLLLCSMNAVAQASFQTADQGNGSSNGSSFGTNTGNVRAGEGGSKSWGRDTTKHDKDIPYGLFNWKLDRQLGNVIPAENIDTLVAHYNNWNNTDGYNGEYNYLGNLGSARLSRIFLNRTEQQPFFFLRQLDYGLGSLDEFRFTNTKSPYTNLSYHSCGDKQTGEDRFRAHFAANFNKVTGWGFNIDYLYGRGYYQSAQNAIFNTNVFGYYRGLDDGGRYDLHVWTQFAHQKNAENGGIEDDTYIHDPQSFPQKYGSSDIPTLLYQTYNRNDFQTYYLTQRYYLGYHKERPEMDSIRNAIPGEEELLKSLNDSIKEVLAVDTLQRMNKVDSLRNAWLTEHTLPLEFIPAASILHTLQIDHLNHRYYGYDDTSKYYTNHYIGDISNALDETTGFKIKNTVGLAMQEGFKKWVKMGITAFASHEYEHYTLPSASSDTITRLDDYTKNKFNVGGQINKVQGQLLHYNATGEVTLLGTVREIGAFRLEGTADLNLPLFKKDTVQVAAHAFIKNQRPDFYLEHYHSQSAWWDTELDMEKRVRIEGTLSNKRSKTSVKVGLENLTKYAYLAMDNTLINENNEGSTSSTDYTHAVRVAQADENIQVFSATLKQDFRLGPLNWENEVTFQTTSNKDILPLPALNVYSNLYLKFVYAKVLRIELGADVRYFTKYYAPDFSPNLSQFAVQDVNNPRMEIGNYPIINAYANLHLKRCRIYVAANHVNAGTGNMFLAPHYPINPMTIHFGVCWNFFN